MPRIARAVALEFPHHVVQRGNNREKVFINEEDKKKYLSLLKEYSGKLDTYIPAYCLMSNHVHLLTRPIKNESLYKMMQGITLYYTQYFNRTYKRTGRVWESRYHSCVVDKEKYLWAVARYIEQNPVRANSPAFFTNALHGGELAVKVVDIFGNDTMTIVEVTV